MIGRTIALAALLCGSLFEHASAANLIRNGGFEKPVAPDGGYLEFATGDRFTGWKVVGAPGNVDVISGNFTYNGFHFIAKAGLQWLDLSGTSNTATGVQQSVQTTVGQAYNLIFFVGNDAGATGCGTASTVNVFIDGAQVLSATNRRGETADHQVWQKFAFPFTATKSTTKIAFINGDPSNDSCNGLDAVSLVAVP